MKNLLIAILLLPLFAVGQINDTWEAVKVGTTDMGKIYVGSSLVWQKQAALIQYIGASSAYNQSASLSTGTHANTNVGDLLILILRTKHGVTYSSAPSGWSTYYEAPYMSFFYPNVVVWYKIARCSDLGANTTINLSATPSDSYSFLNKLTIRTNASSTYFGIYKSMFRTSNNTTSPPISLDQSNSIVISTIMVNGDYSFSSNSGWTTISEVFTGGTNLSEKMIYQIDTDGGINTNTFTWSAASYFTVLKFEVLGY